MAEGISMLVPFGSITFAGPCPSSRLLMPVMVVSGRCDGTILWKYLLSLRMECNVPLSRIHMFSSEIEGAACGFITR